MVIGKMGLESDDEIMEQIQKKQRKAPIRLTTENIPETPKRELSQEIDKAVSEFKSALLDRTIEDIAGAKSEDVTILQGQIHDLTLDIQNVKVQMKELNDNVILALQRKGPNDELQRETLTKLNRYLDNWL